MPAAARGCPRRAIVLLGALLCAGEVPAAPDPAFNIREIADGVFVHVGRHLALDAPGHDDIANIGFVVGSACVAVVDTGGSTSIGRALHASIQARTRVPICYVINTHVHVDHVLGNAAFLSDRPEFVGHARLKEAMIRSRDFFIRQYAGDLDQPPSPDQIIGPGRLVDQAVDLDLGGRRLSLKAWPEAHTDSDLTVIDRKTGVLFAGDLLFRERLPALDGSVTGWVGVLDQLAASHVRLCVPGHGMIAADVDSAIAAERRYLTAVIDGVRSELKSGNSMQHAIGRVAAAEESRWLLWPETHPHNVARAYQQLEWE
jgi:quinoprotein relay system zinc metallohydrolase 2